MRGNRVVLWTVLIFVLCLVVLAYCVPEEPLVTEGTIMDSRYLPETTEVEPMPVVMGKITTLIPMRKFVPASWQLLIYDGVDAEWVSVTAREYWCVNEGDYVILNGSTWCKAGGNE